MPEAAHGFERLDVSVSERVAPTAQRVTQQRFGLAEPSLVSQQDCQVVHHQERVLVRVAERAATQAQRLAIQLLRLGRVLVR